MGENDEIIDQIIAYFPLLKHDKHFKITSPINVNYNCIAWACNYSNRWMQPSSPGTPPELEAIRYWPPEATEGVDVKCLIEAFQAKGYELCEHWEHEEGYQKVALYVENNSTTWTHASRELMSEKVKGKWTSKLGQSHDIQHGSPYTIEGNSYGKVYCIMRRVWP